MGDDTAKRSGRLSLDPLKHIDPMGFLMLLLVRFGWAKPVPINENNFRNRNIGLFLVSIAGITMNLILALIFHFVTYFSIGLIDVPAYYQVMNGIVRINIMLAAFNLLPIPPLDGSKIIYSFLPLKLRYKFYQYESYGTIILLLLLISGSIGFFLSPVISGIINFLNYIINLVM